MLYGYGFLADGNRHKFRWDLIGTKKVIDTSGAWHDLPCLKCYCACRSTSVNNKKNKPHKCAMCLCARFRHAAVHTSTLCFHYSESEKTLKYVNERCFWCPIYVIIIDFQHLDAWCSFSSSDGTRWPEFNEQHNIWSIRKDQPSIPFLGTWLSLTSCCCFLVTEWQQLNQGWS